MSGLKREDEYRLKELTQLVEEKGRSNLSEEQQLLLQLLEDRYNKFLDEGLRKLREAASPSSSSAKSPRGFRLFSSGRASPRVADERSETGDPPNDGSFSSPLVPPPQAAGKLWTWVLDHLVVGGIPYASQTTDTPGHLCELNEQCFQRRARIAAVVSCLDVEESTPPGFAVAKDWEQQLSTNTFFYVACIPRGSNNGDSESSQPSAAPEEVIEPEDFSSEEIGGSPIPADPAFEEIITVCQNIGKLVDLEPKTPPTGSGGDKKKKGSGGSSDIKHRFSIVGQKPEKKKVVFVHCKAGLARSWVFAMCYLLCILHKSYDEADSYLRNIRSFDPQPCHVTFVKRFEGYIKSPRFASQTDEEEKYVKILADVLSLSPKYRLKLLQDLEKLT